MKTALRSVVKGKLRPFIAQITIRFLYTAAVKYSSLHWYVPNILQTSCVWDTVLLIEDMVLARKILRKVDKMKRNRFYVDLGNRMTTKGNESFPAFVFLCFRYERTPASYIFGSLWTHMVIKFAIGNRWRRIVKNILLSCEAGGYFSLGNDTEGNNCFNINPTSEYQF